MTGRKSISACGPEDITLGWRMTSLTPSGTQPHPGPDLEFRPQGPLVQVVLTAAFH